LELNSAKIEGLQVIPFTALSYHLNLVLFLDFVCLDLGFGPVISRFYFIIEKKNWGNSCVLGRGFIVVELGLVSSFSWGYILIYIYI
jgi:hypothetical protein